MAKKIEDKSVDFPFGKENFILMFTGIAVVTIGFLLMIGGGSPDPKVFDESIFSTQRITVAPILVILGLVIEVFAIMKKPKE